MITDNVMMVDNDMFIDFEKIFALIAESPDRDFYLKHLPEELQQIDLTYHESKLKVKDYCMQSFSAEKLTSVK
jgi:hypothetical protein